MNMITDAAAGIQRNFGKQSALFVKLRRAGDKVCDLYGSLAVALFRIRVLYYIGASDGIWKPFWSKAFGFVGFVGFLPFKCRWSFSSATSTAICLISGLSAS